jgi:hypothetical protein
LPRGDRPRGGNISRQPEDIQNRASCNQKRVFRHGAIVFSYRLFSLRTCRRLLPLARLPSISGVWPLAAWAQQRRYRIGHLAIAAPTDTPPPPPANWNAFVQGLREAGYTEGRDIEFEHRSAHDKPELFSQLASELADLKVDVIFARGTWALAAAKNATRTIPIAGIDLEIDPVEGDW